MPTPHPFIVLSLLALAMATPPLAAQGSAAPAGSSADSAVLLPVPDDATVSLTVWFKVGSENDPVGKEGLAALTGALIAQGATTANSYEQILSKLYPLAAAYDVRVDREMTTLSGRVHRDKLDAYYALFTDAYLHPAFKPEDFERLRSDAVNFLEKSLRYASDEELGKAALWSFVYAGTPYAHPPDGTVAGLKAITLDDVKSFYVRYYSRGNAVVALGGGYSPELLTRFEGSLAGLPSGAPSPAPAPVAAPITGRQVLIVAKPKADASISFGFPLDVHRGDRDFYALWIANSWLGEHRNSSSHLYQVIRETRGLNYGDYSYVEAFPEGGRRQFPPANVGRRGQLFEVWIRTLPAEQAQFALRAAMREVQALIDHGMSEEQFSLTRDFLRKYVLHFADTTEDRLGYAVDDRFYGIGAPGHLARFRQMMDSLTREDVNRAIQQHWHLDKVKIAIVTGDAEGLAKALASDAASPITYPKGADKPEAVLAEDKIIASYPLGIKAEDVQIVPVESMFEK